MPKVIYIESTGFRHEVDAESGSTVMETAIRNGVSGIVAECGGACTCATCHVYVDQAWYEVAGELSSEERDMLDFAYDIKSNSRLSCQIKISDDFEGFTVHLPDQQGD